MTAFEAEEVRAAAEEAMNAANERFHLSGDGSSGVAPDDEREVLERLLSDLSDPAERADAILAAGFRRQTPAHESHGWNEGYSAGYREGRRQEPPPPTDDEREAAWLGETYKLDGGVPLNHWTGSSKTR